MPKRIAIVGGGISGLSAAFALEEKRRAGAPVEYVVYEAHPRLGGVLVTERVEGCLIEAGPDSFLTEKPWAADLCRQLGIGDQLIGSNDQQRKTYILAKGKLVAMPDGLMFMVPTKILPTIFSPLFSMRTKILMAREWFHPPLQAKADETVAELVKRHYGPEMVDLLADPLLSGVYGGDASQLSVRAVLPRFAEMETTHGSLGRSMLSARRKMAGAKSQPPPLFTSLEEGMQQMVDTLLAFLNANSQRTSTPVQSVIPQEGGWTVSAGYQSDQFDGLIIATPAPAASALLQMVDVNLSHELGEIPYSSSVTVTLGYDDNVRRSLPPGFGFLIPRTEGCRTLAATFVHNKFPHRAPENRAVVRCFLGGSRDEKILHSSDDDILRIVRDELKQILGLDAKPLFTRIYKWKGAMAQYNVGHLERVHRIESLCKNFRGLALAGNAFTGIGVPDCVRSGKEAARRVLAAVGVEERFA